MKEIKSPCVYYYRPAEPVRTRSYFTRMEIYVYTGSNSSIPYTSVHYNDIIRIINSPSVIILLYCTNRYYLRVNTYNAYIGQQSVIRAEYMGFNVFGKRKEKLPNNYYWTNCIYILYIVRSSACYIMCEYDRLPIYMRVLY